MTNKWILIRGLTRGNIHWGNFPELLIRQGQEIEFLEIPGNGILNDEMSPLFPIDAISKITNRSKFFHQKEKYNILAISLGGMIALKWAELYPNNINKVFIINSSLSQLSPFYERLRPHNYFKIANALFFKSPEEQEKTILEITSNNFGKSSSFVRMFGEFSKNYPFQKINFIRQLLLAKNIQINSIPSSKIKIIFSANDRLVSPKCSNQIAKKFSLEKFENFNAGHDLPLDDPEWLINIILK